MSLLVFCQEAAKQANLGNWQSTLVILQSALDECRKGEGHKNDGIYTKTLKIRIQNNIAVARFYLQMEYTLLETDDLPPVSKEYLAYNLGNPTKDLNLHLGSLLNEFVNDQGRREEIKVTLVQMSLNFNQVYQIMDILDQVHNPKKVLSGINLKGHPRLELVFNALVHHLNAKFYFNDRNVGSCCDELYAFYVTKNKVGISPGDLKIYNTNLALINDELLGKSRLARILRNE